MPKKALPYVLAVFLLTFSFLAWFSVDRAVRVEGASDFVYPAVFFSLYVIFLGLFFIFVSEGFFSFFVILVSFGASIFFSGSLYQTFFVLVGISGICISRLSVRRDLDNSLKLKVGNSLGVGMREVVLMLSLIIASQYYFSINSYDPGRLVPKFESNRVTGRMINFVLSRINSDFETSKDNGLTIDQFLDDMYENLLEKQEDEVLKKMERENKDFFVSDEKKAIIGEAIGEMGDGAKKETVMVWKKEISDLAGYEVSGGEKAVDVMVSLINNKAGEIAASVGGNGGINKVAAALAIGLFLALVPLGTILSKTWIFGSWVVFLLFIKIGLVKVEKEQVEAERIK